MKKKLLFLATFILINHLIFVHPIWAKYVIEERMVIATIQIDKTKPTLSILYSEKNITDKNVLVTITADEEIQALEGWKLQKDKKTLGKEFEKNTKEEIIVKDLSGNETREKIIINNIDKEAPIILIEEISNSNTESSNDVNKKQTIKMKIKIVDDRKIKEKLLPSDIHILVGGKEENPKKKDLIQESETSLELILEGFEEEGNLEIQIPKGSIKDEANHGNEEVIKNTKIEIKNTKKETRYSQNMNEEKRVEAVIIANEFIQKLKGWTVENNKI